MSTRPAARLDYALAASRSQDRAGWKIDLSAPTKSKLSEFRVGIWADHLYCHVDADTRALLQHVTGLLRTAGADIDDSTEPVDFAESDKLFQRLMYATSSATATDAAFAADVEAAQKIPVADPSGPFLHSRPCGTATGVSPTRPARSSEARGRRTSRSTTSSSRRPRPLWLSPIKTSTPPPQRHITVDGQKRSFYDQTGWLNLTSPVGLPSLVLPAGRTDAGLPLSVQIIGPYLVDRTVLEAAKQLANRLPSPVRPPAFSV
ncbi:amidase family protein [Streptomyces sp. ALI-76-A]|uniref:amidase family protein n=1 Tax=Streptomyces sp. ALI-76-A TaxID=3025736 RepID=UPI00256F5432|nr:amidase family protein [Streptomyces sp. ALI-76-A]MDL5199743.1 amidase family protein [Streptomyces sp. ALI-76-A]